MDKKTANDDFFKIAYIILDELYACLKKGIRVNLDTISPERFKIEEGYLIEILWNLQNEGCIDGAKILTSEAGTRLVRNLSQIKITAEGVRYLQENPQMQKIHSELERATDWATGL